MGRRKGEGGGVAAAAIEKYPGQELYAAVEGEFADDVGLRRRASAEMLEPQPRMFVDGVHGERGVEGDDEEHGCPESDLRCLVFSRRGRRGKGGGRGEKGAARGGG